MQLTTLWFLVLFVLFLLDCVLKAPRVIFKTDQCHKWVNYFGKPNEKKKGAFYVWLTYS